MSPPGRPKGEYRRAQPEGTPVSVRGYPMSSARAVAAQRTSRGSPRRHLVAPWRVNFNCAQDISATMKKISVEMAAARPKFWPASVKAMR